MIRKGLTALLALAVLLVFGNVRTENAAAAEETTFEPVNLTSLSDGGTLFDRILPVVSEALELSQEDEDAISAEDFYEVDLGNYPKGYSRQFIAFVYNYEWIELVLVAANEDASKIKVLDRASSSDEGDMFLNTSKIDFTTDGNHIYVWSQAPFSAYQSSVDLEWSGDRFYYVTHDYDDPTARYYEEKSALLKAKNLDGLIDLHEDGPPAYFAAYADAFLLAGPTLKFAQQKAIQANKKSAKTALAYIEYGLDQYAEAFYGTADYRDGKLTKAGIVGSDDLYPEGRLTLGVYVAALNDYGYYLDLTGRTKEAKRVLDNVVKLVPSRTVAYLNLADVEWKLGQKAAAKTHYKQYWKLLGNKASSVAPKRVQERINAK